MDRRNWEPEDTLSEAQKKQLVTYASLLASFNRKHNLVSAGTEAHIKESHINHCLTLLYRPFPDGSTVVDWGTGGGLPAIPLAIAFPRVNFVAIDAVGKKIHAVRAMSRRLELQNLEAWHGRAEAWDGSLHYSVSRATAPLKMLWTWHSRCVTLLEKALLEKIPREAWRPGLVCLKGGDLSQEIEALKTAFPSLTINKLPLNEIMRAKVYDEKYILHICNTLV